MKRYKINVHFQLKINTRKDNLMQPTAEFDATTKAKLFASTKNELSWKKLRTKMKNKNKMR